MKIGSTCWCKARGPGANCLGCGAVFICGDGPGKTTEEGWPGGQAACVSPGDWAGWGTAGGPVIG